jgi:hypothetical protein
VEDSAKVEEAANMEDAAKSNCGMAETGAARVTHDAAGCTKADAAACACSRQARRKGSA